MLRSIVWTHLAVLLLSLAGCKADPKNPDYWDKSLNTAKRAKDKNRILSDLRESGNLNPSFVAMLNAHLASERQPEVKANLAHLLGDLKDPASVQPLIDVLDLGNTDSASNNMNKEIAGALARIGDPRAIPALMRLLGSRDAYVRIEAINGLGSTRAKEALEPLMAIANDDSGEPFVCKKAIQALGEIGDARAVPVLIRMMFKERRGVTFYVESSFGLFQIGQPAADALLAVLSGEDRQLHAWAKQNNVIEPALYAKSAQVLGDLLERRAERPLLSRLQFDSEYLDIKLFVRMKMAEALGRLRAKDAVKPLAAMLEEPEAPAREEYIRALVRVGSREAIPALLKSASKGSWESRRTAIAAVAMLGDQRETPLLEKLVKQEPALSDAECKESPETAGCKNPTELARKHAGVLQGYARLLEMARSCQSDQACWAKKLEDADERVRERAAYEIGRSGKAEMADALVKRLQETNLDVRLAVIQSLDWLIADTKEAARKAAASLPNIEQQLSEEKGKTEFVKVNEDLRRLAVVLKRQRA